MCTGMNTPNTSGPGVGMNPVALARMMVSNRLQANTPPPPPAPNSPEQAYIQPTGLTIPTTGNTRSR